MEKMDNKSNIGIIGGKRIKTTVMNGEQGFDEIIAEINQAAGGAKAKNEGNKGKVKSSDKQISINKAKLNVQVMKYIERKGSDNNFEVKLISEEDDDLRILSLNGAYSDIGYIIANLLNMGYVKEDDIMQNTAIAIQKEVREQLESKKYGLMHEFIGWGEYKRKKVFKLFQMENEEGHIESKYVGNLKLEKRGELRGYINGLKKYVVGKAKLEIAFITGVYGILLQNLELSDCNLLMVLYGKSDNKDKKDTSGLGKTTASKLCLTLFGFASELFETYNATDNKIEAQMAEHIVIPNVIDDKMVSSIGLTKKRLKADLLKFVFRFVSGQVKGRLNDSENKASYKIFAPTIITAEESIVEKMIGAETNGQFSRIIEIPCKRGELTNSREHCRQLENFMSNYAGVGAEAFVQWILKKGLHGNKLKEKYEEWIEKINYGVLGTTDMGSRVANKVGILMLGADLLNQCFGLGMSIDNIQRTLEDSICGIQKKTNFADKAYEHLCQYVRDNRNRFVDRCADCKRGEDDDDKAGHLGHYKTRDSVKDNTKKEIWILGTGLEEIFSNFDDVKLSDILDDWYQTGIIIHGTEKEQRRTFRKTLYNNKKQDHVYIIRMPDKL